MNLRYGNFHKQRGKHFKLFSDELPRFDFDKATIDEYGSQLHRWHDGQARGSNIDQSSLPPLGTPEWGSLSDLDEARPKSNHSRTNRPLNPDFKKARERIKRRNTFRDSSTFSHNSFDQRLSFRDKFHTRPTVKQDVWQTPRNKEKDNEKVKPNVEEIKPHVVGKPPVPKRIPVSRDLHEKSKTDKSRRRGAQENVEKEVSIYKTYTDHSCVKEREQDSVRPEDTSEVHSDELNSNVAEFSIIMKPGILKHGVRLVSLSNSKNNETFLKPRLVHEEDIPLLGSLGRHKESEDDEVKISLHVQPPLNRIKDIPFVPLPASKPKSRPKRVNFQEESIKEVTEICESNSNERNYNDNNVCKFGNKNADSEVKDITGTVEKTDKSTKQRNDSMFKQSVCLNNMCSDLNASNARTSVFKSSASNEMHAKVGSMRESVKPAKDSSKHRLSVSTKVKCQPLCSKQGNGSDTNKSSSKGSDKVSDVDSLSNLSSFFDESDIDFNNLPEEIDRSLSGEELIKAYRLWDRKRRKFSTEHKKKDTLRNSDKDNGVTYRGHDHVKTYKLPNKNLDLSPPLISITDEKRIRKGALIELL